MDSPVPITEADLPKIEAKMAELAKNNETFCRKSVSKADALKTFTEKGDEYKVDLIDGSGRGDDHFLYERQLHRPLPRAAPAAARAPIKAVKLTSVAGAYWRGDENEQDADPYLRRYVSRKNRCWTNTSRMLEEAKLRDHRKLGKELELFCFSQRVGAGPADVAAERAPRSANGSERLLAQRAEGSTDTEQVITPHIGMKDLYVTSGHYAKYGSRLVPADP